MRHMSTAAECVSWIFRGPPCAIPLASGVTSIFLHNLAIWWAGLLDSIYELLPQANVGVRTQYTMIMEWEQEKGMYHSPRQRALAEEQKTTEMCRSPIVSKHPDFAKQLCWLPSPPPRGGF